MKLFAELDLDSIQGHVVLLDIDGTLTHNGLSALEQGTLRQVIVLKKNNTVYLCSNSRKHNRNRQVAALAKIDYLDTNLRKPSKKILELIKNPHKKPLLVIGDKFLIDGWFAHRIRAKFIKVKTLNTYKDGLLTQLITMVDTFVYHLFRPSSK